ncbi:MAG: helix-turn-helix domain-containing protein, partial [Hydrogenophaga sp.]|nr:helix-turn-helix domain-containing protein [Hydrogenophaga sp.]
HRLNVIRLRLPALRERREDVPMLTRFFLQQSAKQLGVEPKRISEPAIRLLGTFDFPGNVRQLENVCHWLTVMAPAQVIELKDLPPEVLAMAGTSVAALAAMPEPAALTPFVPPAAPAALSEALQTVSPAYAAPDFAPAHEPVPVPPVSGWESGLQAEALALLEEGRTDVWDVLTRRFETKLIQTALVNTRGRRIEAAHKLGIGRNTITRKIQELNLE